MRRYSTSFFIILIFIGLSSCATKKKKKSKLSLASRTYHNMTSHYNGYFNANELYKQSVTTLKSDYQDNYNQILELYPEVATDQEKSVDADLETAVQKTSIVVKLHRKGDWTDDCYLLFGKCRFIQKDYESAQEAFEYLAGEYNLKALEKKKGKKKKKKKKKKSSSKNKKPEKPEKYPLEKRPAYEEGYVWLAKTLIERGSYDDAELIITRMKNDEKTHENVKDEMAEVLAYSSLKQKNYSLALEHLQEAFDLSKRKRKRVRYAYIIAQIHQKEGRGEDAVAYFEKVLKNNPKYDMEFNARLSMVTNAWLSGKESAESIVKALNKMLKDSKNKEYKDRIYYTLAQVHLKEGNKNAAIASLRKSLEFNVDNKSQKAESYLLLGDLYYDAEEYVYAKNYFDSTLVTLNTTDERLDRVKRMSDNLIDIAKNITIITMQDSLLAINDLGEGEKRKLAARLLKEKKKADDAKASAGTKITTGGSTNSLGAAKSSFFVYSDKSVKRGKKNFDKRWGDRNLEDNWRRSNKKGGGFLSDESTTEEIAENLSDKEVEDIFKDVPNTPAKIKASNEMIRKAMFALGTSFRDKIQNNKKAVETLEGLLARYSDTSDKLDAYYNLYLAHTDLKNKGRAKFYYDKIVNEFPNTTYARVLTDPSYLSDAAAKEKEVSDYYDKTYGLFTKGDYKGTAKMIAATSQKFGKENKMKAKFALLGAMCTGSLEGKEAYVKSLKEVVAKYPKTDEEKRAKEILRYLQSGKITAPSSKPKPDPKDPGKDKDPAAKDDPVADSPYKMDDAKSHYFIASLSDGAALKDAKDAVADYNQEFFAKKAYRANSIYLQTGNKTPLIVVRRFRNREDAMTYYNKVMAEQGKYLGEGVEAEMFVVAQSNYREILKAKSVGAYITFFKENYLK